MVDFVTALGLALVLEGMLYGLFPNAMRKMMERVLDEPAEALRYRAVLIACIGLTIIWFARV